MKRWLLITLLAIGIISLCFSSNVFACGRRFGGFRSCGTVSCGPVCGAPICDTVVHQTVCDPIISTPVIHDVIPVFAYPVLVPAFQFQYVPTTYAVPTAPVAGYPQTQYQGMPAPQQQYGYQPQYPGVPQGMPAPQQQYGQQSQQFGLSKKEQIRELAKALMEEMNKLAEGGGSEDSGPPSVPGITPSLPPQPVPQPAPQPQQPNAQLTQFVFGAFSRTCSQCHTGVGSKKGFQMFTQPGVVNQKVSWSRVKDAIVSDHMPPPDSQFQLGPQEKQAILEWLKQIGVN